MWIRRWSKSLHRDAVMCPLYAHLVHNVKAPTKTGYAAKRGRDIHAYRERRIMGEELPESLRYLVGDPVAERSISGSPVIAACREIPLPNGSVYDDEETVFFRCWSEVKIRLDESGNVLDPDADNEAFIAIIDLIGPTDSTGPMHLEDLKTGAVLQDDMIERTAYVAAAAQLFRSCNEFVFHYWNPATEQKISFDYKLMDSSFTVISDDNWSDECFAFSIWDWLLQQRKQIEELPLAARRGPYCDDMYGDPCPFLGKQCVAAELDNVLTTYEARAVSLFKTALSGNLNAYRPDHNDISTLMAMSEWLTGACRNVRKTVKAWSSINGPVSIDGATQYGFSPTKKVDKAMALKILLDAGLGPEDIASIISISPSDIERMPGKFSELRELIEFTAISEAGGTRWGKLKATQSSWQFSETKQLP